MNLTFLGRGNSTNYNEKNNSAFFKEDDNLFLIDCGETVFQELLKNNLLKDINNIHIMITHTHSDHIGSLASLIMYCYFNVNIRVNIILPTNNDYLNDIKTILKCMGCNQDMYNIISQNNYSNIFQSFNSLEYLETKHVDYLTCYSIIFYTNNGLIFYSGDSKELTNIKKVLSDNSKLDKLYIDVTSNNSPNNIHLYIGSLNNEIPENIKPKVYCMHFNNQTCITQAQEYGFNIAPMI